MTAFYGVVHVDHLNAYYAIFKDMLLHPGFRENDFIRLKTNQLNYLEKTLNEPRWLFFVEPAETVSSTGGWAKRYKHYDWM